jgi:hypothetical protein
MTGNCGADYSFDDGEVKALARLFRSHDELIDPCLDSFRGFLEGCLYRVMTIEEAEAFFDEN